MEARIVEIIRDFIVRAVGEDMGTAMTRQAEDLYAELKPALADVFQEGMEALALATLPGHGQPVNPYKN